VDIPGDIHPRFSSRTSGAHLGGAHLDDADFSAANYGAEPDKLSLAREAHESLYFPLDNRSTWKGWRWERLLNPGEGRDNWTANPRFFQNAASRYIYRLSMRCFRNMPFSVNAEFCYIKIKQFEEDFLTSIVEGLGLGMGGSDVFNLLEVPA